MPSARSTCSKPRAVIVRSRRSSTCPPTRFMGTGPTPSNSTGLCTSQKLARKSASGGFCDVRLLLLISFLILSGAWIVVFIRWLWVLMKYCKAYREYEQCHGKPYQSPCESNKRTGLILQNLRRFGLLLSNLGVFFGKANLLLNKSNIKRNFGAIKKRIVFPCRSIVNKPLKFSGRCSQNEFVHRLVVSKGIICFFRHFFWIHKRPQSDAKKPTSSSGEIKPS